MKNLTFCPQCGASRLKFVEDKKLVCSDCDFTLYHNVAGAVAVIIKHKEEILFTRRNQNPQKGKLDLAGGFTDADESAEQTCQREIQEELNFNIDLSQLKYIGSLPNIYRYKNIDYHTLDLFFEYELNEKPDFQLEKSELQEVVWIPKSKLNIEDLAFESQKKFFSKYGFI
ncbi:MAG: NUDIX hydrolase [Flavobacteriales bacterium]|nr:MAG: NUDIX hydrolase [Flavobacteriales bacterium]